VEHDGGYLIRELRRVGEDAEYGSFVCERMRASRAGLLYDIRRAGTRRGDEHAVPAGGVDHRELLLYHRARLDNAERQEIVGNVGLFEHLT
jgi:hypothetical protein